jgi:hypothetical protein
MVPRRRGHCLTKSAAAATFFCLAGARAFQLRLELIAYNPMEGLIGDCEGKCLPEPALDVQVTRELAGGRQARLELSEDRGRQGLLPRGRPWLFIG